MRSIVAIALVLSALGASASHAAPARDPRRTAARSGWPDDWMLVYHHHHRGGTPATTDSLFPHLFARMRARGAMEAAGGLELRRLFVETLLREARYDDPRLVVHAESLLADSERLSPRRDGLWLFDANLVATALRRARRPAAAESLVARALVVATARETAEPRTAAVTHRLAGLDAADRGHPERAAFHHRRAWELRVEADGPESPDAVQSVIDLAYVQLVLGEPERADSLLRTSWPGIERSLAADDPLLPYALALRSSARDDLGDLAGALRLREDAVSRLERMPGPPRAELPGTLRHLAASQRSLGDTIEARRTLDRAIALGTRLWGDGDREVNTARLDRAELIGPGHGVDRAIAELKDATARLERTLGDHEWVGRGHFKLGHFAERHGRPEVARPALARALEVYGRSLPAHHVLFNHTHRLAARLASIDGDDALARMHLALAESALATLPRDPHPRRAELAYEWAAAHERAGRFDDAWRRALEADSIAAAYEAPAMAGLTEREALTLAAERTPALALALRRAIDAGAATPDRAARLAATWQAVARRRAQVLDELAARRAAPAPGADLDALVERHRATSERYARTLVSERGDGPEAAARRAERRAAWRAAERDLAAASAGFRRRTAHRELTFDRMAAALPADAALVAYVQLRDLPAGVSPAGRPPDSYAALVLRGGSAPVAIGLGSVADLDARIARWRAAIQIPPGLMRAAHDAAEAAARRHGDALRRELWDPLARHVAGASRVFVVADGAIHLVSFAALPAASGGYLVEGATAFHTLGAESDLLPAGDTVQGAGLLAMGGADFDGVPATATADGRRGVRPPCPDFASLAFPPLPASGDEIARVVSAWSERAGLTPADSAVALTGALASESAFKRQAPGRRVLHLATHGFFLAGDCVTAADSRRGIGGTAPSRPAATSAPAAVERHPLRLSGLVWAGANRRAHAPDDGEDGILTAEEVAALDLSGAEWAVLSACQTGAGEIRAGEGVLGLQRAFQAAGARTVIMSLWEVDDAATRDWMTLLYRGRNDGLATADAMRAATRGVLAARRARGDTTHPFYWGAFVAAGDYR